MSHGWEPHNDSCECHVGICADCGCTNETPGPSLDALENVLADLRAEVAKARAKHPPIHSPHEGWAVIREELDPELWEHVCGDTGRTIAARQEALQVAAMGVRYILDLIDDPAHLSGAVQSPEGAS